ncbi:LysR family transcriptional regulator [Psychromonas sp.]|nr:LysR family transcriptional regulator [Psychromonas sp.]
MDITSRLLMLLEVVEQGSFAKAAELRNTDRSVISKQISRLEDELGLRLLNRTTRSFSLTAAGAEMIKKAKELRDLLSDTLRIAENYHQEPHGLLKITASAFIGRRYLQPVVNDFQQRFPQVEVELRVDDRLVDIISEGFDLAFRIGVPKDSSLIARTIARNRWLILASPDFIQDHGLPRSIEDLNTCPAATYANAHFRVDNITYLNKVGETHEQKMKSIFRTNDAEVLKMKILSGRAYGLLPAFLIENEIKTGQLVPLLTNLQLVEHSPMYAVYPHRDLPVRTRLFLDAVCEYLGKDRPIWEKMIPDFDKLYQGK